MKSPLIALAAAALLSLPPALANDGAKLVGTWKLVSFVTEFQDGSPPRATFGDKPTGYLVYTAEGRLMTLIEAEGRKPAATDEERAGLMRSMLAWTGKYRMEGERHTLMVDGASNPQLKGTERPAIVRVDGNRLTALSPWVPSPNLPNAPIVRGVTVWERVK
jgi:hypothetical protein